MKPERRTLAPRFVSSRGVRCGIVVVLIGCGRQESPRDSATVAPSPASAAAPRIDSAPATTAAAAKTLAPSAAPACVSEGEWQLCSVEKRLTDAGYVPVNKGSAPSGIFPVQGTTYALGQAQAHVYVFGSAKAREAAIASIDTTTVSRRGVSPTWPLPPALITSNNVAVVLVSDNGRLIERVQNAIRAGLPSATH